MVSIREAIVVEGRYDADTLRQLVDAPVLETSGFGIFKDRELLELLRLIARKRRLIILTDSDGAGFLIRSYLKGALPKDRVLHAYIPDIPGKEKRKAAPGREGKLGVEGMSPEILLEALRRCGATVDDTPCVAHQDALTKTDLYALGLSGSKGSREKRLALTKKLGLPARMSSNALLQTLNILYDKDELIALLKESYD